MTMSSMGTSKGFLDGGVTRGMGGTQGLRGGHSEQIVVYEDSEEEAIEALPQIKRLK